MLWSCACSVWTVESCWCLCPTSRSLTDSVWWCSRLNTSPRWTSLDCPAVSIDALPVQSNSNLPRVKRIF